MADETDGVLEATDEQLRIALTVASQFGERLARLREEVLRSRQAAAEQEHRELQNRFDAERLAARASLTVSDRPGWWDTATVTDIARVYETAIIWRDHDDVAKTASEKMRDEIRNRFGIDAERPGADPGSVADALRQAEIDRAEEREQRRHAGDELTASQLLLEGAEGRDRDASEIANQSGRSPALTTPVQREANVAREGGALAYDSAERRQGFGKSLATEASESELRARLIADIANAEPARNAVTTGGVREPRGRPLSRSPWRDRGGITR